MSWPARRAVLSGRENVVELIGSQTLVFGWLSHPDASLEVLASVAALREVEVTDTAVHTRFTQAWGQILHSLLEEMTSGVVEAGPEVPLELGARFEGGVLQATTSR